MWQIPGLIPDDGLADETLDAEDDDTYGDFDDDA